jgi:hypothetical protein
MSSMRNNHPFLARPGLIGVSLVLSLLLLSCKLTASGQPAQITEPAPVVTLTAISPAATQPADEPAPAAGGTQPLELPASGDPALALLPTARQDLAALEGMPRYTLALDIDPSLSRFQGRARVEYTNQESVPLDRVYFRLLPNGGKSYGDGSLTVSDVQVDGEKASSKISMQDTVLEVDLPASLAPGQQAQIDLAFAGEVPLDFGSGTAGYGIYNLDRDKEFLSLSGWYPILAVYDEQGWNLDPVSEIGDSVYSDTAQYTVQVCAPPDLVVASTGSQVAEQASGSKACIQLESGPTRDFYLAASPNFQLESRQVDGVTIHSYSLPGHEQAARQALGVAEDSLHIYNEKFGSYPFAELDMVDAPMRNALGVEYPGIILIGNTLFDEPEEPGFPVTIAHEVAHQWWYSVVGNDVFDAPWLDEGLTTYSSSLYFEFGPSPEFARGLVDYWQQRFERLKSEGKDDRIAQDLAHFESLGDPGVYSGVVYTKAALFFQALRQEIGDRAFFEALQQYYLARKYGIAAPADLLAAFEQAAGRKLDAFYEQWLYAPEK